MNTETLIRFIRLRKMSKISVENSKIKTSQPPNQPRVIACFKATK